MSTPIRPDNYVEWDRWLLDKQDRAPDTAFYAFPRKVNHIDDHAIAAATGLYREHLPAGGAILDLMSAWRSHLPTDVRYASVTGLGMNAEEMHDNPQLTSFVTHDLNKDQALPFGDASFDGACCTVSVQYLQKPVEVFREVARVLRPGAPFVLTFSNRCFPNKAVNIWRELSDEDHMRLVAIYFQAAGGWRDISMQDRSGLRGDPLFAVWAVVE
jgi:SAM-dependent methyltransferase